MGALLTHREADTGTQPARRTKYERQAVAAVRKYAQLLGLHGAWMFKFGFGRVDDDKGLDGANAYVGLDRVHQHANVQFNERANPAFYEYEAAHEVLHVFFDPIQCVVDELPEPSRTLLDVIVHQMVDRLARVLSGQAATNGEEHLDAPPWEGGK